MRLADLRDPVVRKLKFRGWTLTEAGGEFALKQARLEKLWQARLGA